MAEPRGGGRGGIRSYRAPGRGYGRGGNSSARGGPNRPICRYFRDQGTCRFGEGCRYSHDLGSAGNGNSHSTQRATRVDETIEQQLARFSYNTWRSLIRDPPHANDTYTMLRLWEGALDILNADDRDWKQTLPQDLDDDEKYQGRRHIRALLDMRAQTGQLETFTRISRYFLLVITHPALLDCLSVDTYVGALYNFICGANGTRAVPFFQHLCEVLVAVWTATSRQTSTASTDSTLIAMSTALCELLRREPRTRFNDDLPDLVNSLETAAQLMTEGDSSITSHIVNTHVGELRAMIARAQGLLSDNSNEPPAGHSNQTTASTYPRGIIIPSNRHDNDKVDITEFTIFPTRAEIMSDVQEFIPSMDPDQPHFLTDKAERHIDTCFRLLRHDTFGKLKEALADLLDAITKDPASLSNPKVDFGDMRAYPYSNAFVSYVTFNSRGGLQAQISFLQPYSIRKKSAAERRRWWDESRRLDDGVLLSFIWIQNSVVHHLFLTVLEKNTDKAKESSLSGDANMATVTVKILNQDQPNVEAFIELSCQKTRGVLVEYPRVLPATFVPVLENLQHMQRLSRLPFRQWILPDRVDIRPGFKAYHDIPPPLYARSAGFAFPLKSILKNDSDALYVQPGSSTDDKSLIDEMEAKTALDRGQCQALVAALTREFAFIQGPPGTGKSYLGIQLMKVLMGIKSKAKLGPIVVVCYTNHALDQFLEHLLIIGLQKVIRIGGQSRSEMLEDHNLRKITQSEMKTRSEGTQAAIAYKKLEALEGSIKSILGRLHGVRKRAEWKNFEYFLRRKYPRIHAQFRQNDEEGFTLVGRHPFDVWRAVDPAHKPSWRSPQASQATTDPVNLIREAAADIHSLSSVERQALVDLWTQELQSDAKRELFETVKDADTTQRHLANVHEELNRRVLQEADVIGLTTTGLAKNIMTLQHVRCKVVICEEAGEVMEPHMISALLPTVEHCIQIGDHEQLRPSITNYKDLSLESKRGLLYQLDRSQFERLSVGERGRPLMPIAQLNVQRRMRPEISILIRETIYDKLVDHPCTTLHPNVVGMRNNVFWLDHDYVEDQKQAEVHHQKSQSNAWEVQMVHALVRHVVRQGIYASNDIAVLTPYTGQLQKLRTVLRNDFEVVLSERDEDALAKDGFTSTGPSSEDEGPGPQQDNKRVALEKKKLSDLLRVATVDNFQGEEAKIVIVSLVRSNEEKKVGFLKTTNRINVLLSRAQHGMFLIGNTETYSNIPMWQKVIDMLRATDSVGTSLGLCCPRHMDTVIQVQQPEDFARFSPEGGCREACLDRLPDCGHRCQARCHSKAMHDVWQCEQPCQRQHQPCNHACQKQTCGEDCGRCMILVTNVRLPCGHIKDIIACHLTQNLGGIQCNALVYKTVPSCNHIIQVKCSQDVTEEHFRCSQPCGYILSCGHACPGTCGSCNIKDADGNTTVRHLQCRKICGRRFGTCNHTCPKRCHSGSSCGLCQKRCEVRCKHSRCDSKCHEACTPCVESCTWSCLHHGQCTMPCSAPCNRVPCDKRCTKLLPCGHQCPGLCEEECLPQYCQACGMKPDAVVDMIIFKEYHEIDLDETPVIALPCGHFFTAETLDGMIGLKEVYNINAETGEISGLKDISSAMATSIPRCPDCQSPIRQFATQRYNRLINRAVVDEMTKRFIVTGQEELQKIEESLTGLANEFEKVRPTAIPTSFASGVKNAETRAMQDVAQRIQNRYKESTRIQNAIRQLQRRVADRHQPCQKLHDATVHAMRRNASLDRALEGLSLDCSMPPGGPDQLVALGAKTLEIKTECIIIEDKFNVLSAIKFKHDEFAASLKFPGGSPSHLSKPFLQSCAKLIAECSEKNLPKLAVEAALYYARIARLFQASGPTNSNDRQQTAEYREQAKLHLEKAQKLCEQQFQDAESLLQAVNESIKLLRKEWYEEVTAEELAAIKQAMVSGSKGIATHSGHWYNCANGHPFAIGECGMPMELARCPECGARIGGQHHEAVQGVTRAMEMER